jgi:HlyD family secretion protein
MMDKRWVLLVVVGIALMGCRTAPTPTLAPLATAPAPSSAAQASGGRVVASGAVVAAKEARLSFALGGRVQSVAVEVSDEVKQGDPLATLDTEGLEANVAQAEAALAVAQANLALVEAQARAEEIAAAAEPIAAAQANLEGAEASLSLLLAGASKSEIEIARLTWEQAKASLWATQAERDGIAGSELNPAFAVSAADAAVQGAEKAVRIAELQYELVVSGPSDDEVLIARAQVDAGRSQVEQAKAQLNLLLAGPSAGAINATRALVQQAQAALEAARIPLDLTTLRAPFDGAIIARAINEGETVLPGQMVLTLADLGHLQVATNDLSERDVAEVAVGQPANIYVEALRSDIPGQVVRIHPQASTIGGDVVYTVIVELNEQPSHLRLGMTVDVEITTR